MKRKLAWFGILAIVAVFIALIYFTFTGAPANVIMAMLFCLILIPIIIYACLFIMKLNDKNNSDSSEG